MALRRIYYIMALAGCLMFYLAYQKWFSWIVLLAVFFLPWMSLLLSLRAMICTKMKLTAPERVELGNEAKIRLEVKSPVPRPPFRCRIRVTKPITGESIILKRRDILPADHCGGLTVQIERAKLYDYLGLFSRKIRRIPACTVRVMPKPVEMPVPPDLTRYLARAWRPKQGGGYAENHEIRPYHPGDTLNLVHWKLSSKMDSLMLREPMEPDQGLMLLTLDLCGTPDELDRKLGRLLWLGKMLLDRQIRFTVIAMTGNGIETWLVPSEWSLNHCMDELLCTPYAAEGSVRDRNYSAAWQFHIGGEPDEE